MALSDDDRAALSAFLDGELDEEATHHMEVRLTLDPELRLEYETLRQTWSLLDFLPQASTSTTFTSRTMERLTLERHSGASTAWLKDMARRVPVAAAGWTMSMAVAGFLGVQLGSWLAAPASPEPVADDETLVRHWHIADLWPLYADAPDIETLRQLNKPDLFGDESGY
jgi:anti-sigma factor RsiW